MSRKQNRRLLDMNTNNVSFYDLIQYGLGNFSEAPFQEFIDALPDRYNKLDVLGFSFGSLRDDYEYAQLIADMRIATLPTYVDPDAPAFERSLGDFEIKKGNIPTQKSRYVFDKRVLQDRIKLINEVGKAGLTPKTQQVILDLFFDSVTKLSQGFSNSLTHQRDQIVSNLQFSLSSLNNARGLKGIVIDFHIPAANKTALTGNARWWTSNQHIVANEGSASDPINDLKNWKRDVERKTLRAGQFHFEMAKDTYQDLLTHTKVLTLLGRVAYPSTENDANALQMSATLTDERRGQMIEQLVGAPIVVRDTMAMQEVFDPATKDLVPQSVENFNKLNAALVPNGSLGEIQGVDLAQYIRPFLDGNSQIATYLNGMLTLTTQVNTTARSMAVEGEMASLCVPSDPLHMYVKTVTA